MTILRWKVQGTTSYQQSLNFKPDRRHFKKLHWQSEEGSAPWYPNVKSPDPTMDNT